MHVRYVCVVCVYVRYAYMYVTIVCVVVYVAHEMFVFMYVMVCYVMRSLCDMCVTYV